MWRFSVVRLLASFFFNTVAKRPAPRHGGLSGLSDRRVNKEELILIRCCFCHSALQMKATKRDIGENYLQTMQYRQQITTAKRLQVMQRIDCKM